VSASAGPPVGGLLVTLDWRWIFLINLPIGIATIIAGIILLPEVREPRGTKLPEALSAVALLLAVTGHWLLTVRDQPAYLSAMFPGLVAKPCSYRGWLAVKDA
jgi:MFS family permease